MSRSTHDGRDLAGKLTEAVRELTAMCVHAKRDVDKYRALYEEAMAALQASESKRLAVDPRRAVRALLEGDAAHPSVEQLSRHVTSMLAEAFADVPSGQVRG